MARSTYIYLVKQDDAWGFFTVKHEAIWAVLDAMDRHDLGIENFSLSRFRDKAFPCAPEAMDLQKEIDKYGT